MKRIGSFLIAMIVLPAIFKGDLRRTAYVSSTQEKTIKKLVGNQD